MEDFSYTLTLASLPLVVCSTKFRMHSQGLMLTQARECQRQAKIFDHRTRDVWFGNKYCDFFTPIEKG